LKILVLGRSGQVGSALLPVLAPLGQVTAVDHEEINLANPDSIRAGLKTERPEVIVNAAAYTAVDKAEDERDLAFAINATGPGILAEEARKLGALLVHYSTDYVYDGEKIGKYVESDRAAPLGVYGASKLAGDLAIAQSGCRHLIFRTSWVYSPGGSNFLLTMLRLARERPELRVVDDQRGAPTSAKAIAEATVQAIAKRDAPSGLYHMTAAGETTWHGFASAIVKAAGLDVPVRAIRSDEYPVKAARPKNSLLDNTKLRTTFGISLPDWRESLRAVMAAIH
jgi:dTDP-4-dehydrorhamnose reductase